MAMSLGGSGVKSDINVTPFVDIVLVLLIIFMVVTPMLSRALDVAVPPKSEATAAQEVTADQLILTVKGQVVGGTDALQGRIEELMKGRKDKIVFFQADNDLPYQTVVDVMDRMRGGGVDKIGLITDENLNVTAPGGGQ
ncbi:MAG: protein TolR [Acidobacteria bacterium]|nr:MAG: protein TolR [Acidobacteriota bacterium]